MIEASEKRFNRHFLWSLILTFLGALLLGGGIGFNVSGYMHKAALKYAQDAIDKCNTAVNDAKPLLQKCAQALENTPRRMAL